jgi:GTP-binding protein
MIKNTSIRNVAIIAHVDHGKTTLVDAMLRQSGIFRANEQMVERVMDSNDLERERGITILAKATGVRYHDIKINIVDTPGHSDFGGEVERALKLVDGVMLLVDASEGPLPQTRYVLMKALEARLPPIVVINKIDRPDARIQEVLNEIYDLFIDLDAAEDQLDFPVIFTNAREGIAKPEPDGDGDDLKPLFEAILEHIPAPVGDPDGICSCWWRISITAIIWAVWPSAACSTARCATATRSPSRSWTARCIKPRSRSSIPSKGLKRVDETVGWPGDILAIAGVEGITIGETMTSVETPRRCRTSDRRADHRDDVHHQHVAVSRDAKGQYVTSRNLRDRLDKELLTNVSIRVEEAGGPDAFKVMGRGELQLAILIEMMRREGFELAVGKPEILTKTIDGKLSEPLELLVIDCPEAFIGVVIEKIGTRKGKMAEDGQPRLGPRAPGVSRSIARIDRAAQRDADRYQGHRDHEFAVPWLHRMAGRHPDAADRIAGGRPAGKTTGHALFNLQERGEMFVEPGLEVYEGMIVGENAREADLNVNIVKEKKLTNMRASSADEAIRLVPPRFESRTGDRIHPRRRTGRGDAGIHPPAQENAQGESTVKLK